MLTVAMPMVRSVECENDETADSVDEGRALRAMYLPSTRTITSLTGICRIACV